MQCEKLTPEEVKRLERLQIALAVMLDINGVTEKEAFRLMVCSLAAMGCLPTQRSATVLDILYCKFSADVAKLVEALPQQYEDMLRAN